jgi:hypothetical protein
MTHRERKRTVRLMKRLDICTRGQAIYQYALVAALVGIIMLATMGAMRVAAGHNLATTQTGLSNESNAP